MKSVKLLLKKRFVANAMVTSLFVVLLLSTMLIKEVAAQTTHEVKITGFAFVPQNLTINTGDTVLWNNTDPVIHTLWFVYVANGSTYLLSDPIPPDTTWTYTFDDVVQLQYYSFDKLWITGFINVTEVHDVAVTDVVTSKDGCLPKPTVGEGCCMNVTVTVENKGDFQETFNVTAYANTTAVGKLQVTLTVGENKTLTFTWNTTGFAKGNYTIKAVADAVSGETETVNNTSVDGIIFLSIPGDVNGDQLVDVSDLTITVTAIPSAPGWPNWNPNVDINGDGICDVSDLVICIGHIPSWW